MPRPAMYSPNISQHSPRLYRLGKHYRVPMTVLADRLICFGLQNLEQVMPGVPTPETPALECVAEEQSPYDAAPKPRVA